MLEIQNSQPGKKNNPKNVRYRTNIIMKLSYLTLIIPKLFLGMKPNDCWWNPSIPAPLFLRAMTRSQMMCHQLRVYCLVVWNTNHTLCEATGVRNPYINRLLAQNTFFDTDVLYGLGSINTQLEFWM